MKRAHSGSCISAAVTLLLLLAGVVSTEAQTKLRSRTQSAKVVIGNAGYAPAEIQLRRGVPAKITFLRTTDSTCATEVVFADYGIRRELPLNEAVVISLTPRAGEFNFTCGMNMHRGKMFVR